MTELPLKDAVKLVHPDAPKKGIWYVWKDQPKVGFCVAVFYSNFNVQKAVMLKPPEDLKAWYQELRQQGFVPSCLKVGEDGKLV